MQIFFFIIQIKIFTNWHFLKKIEFLKHNSYLELKQNKKNIANCKKQKYKIKNIKSNMYITNLVLKRFCSAYANYFYYKTKDHHPKRTLFNGSCF